MLSHVYFDVMCIYTPDSLTHTVHVLLTNSCHPCIVTTLEYCIAGTFQGRKLLRIGKKYDFHGENFR